MLEKLVLMSGRIYEPAPSGTPRWFYGAKNGALSLGAMSFAASAAVSITEFMSPEVLAISSDQSNHYLIMAQATAIATSSGIVVGAFSGYINKRVLTPAINRFFDWINEL